MQCRSAVYQNKDANNYPDVETRMQHLEFVAKNLFYEAPTLALEPIARMIRGYESSPPPQRRYKTELLYKLKFPSSWTENTEIVHIWQNNRSADLKNYELVKPGQPGFKIPRKRE